MSSNIFLLRQLRDIDTILTFIRNSLENHDYYLSLYEVQELLKNLGHLLQQNKNHLDKSCDEVLNHISDSLTKLNAGLSKITSDTYKKVGLEAKTLSANQASCHQLITIIQNRPFISKIKTQPVIPIQKEFEQTCVHHLNFLKALGQTYHNNELQLKLINSAIRVLSEAKKMTHTLKDQAKVAELNLIISDTVTLATTPITVLMEDKNFLHHYKNTTETLKNTNLQPISEAMSMVLHEFHQQRHTIVPSMFSHASLKGAHHTSPTRVPLETSQAVKLGK